ncbi:hypothetical protein [Paenibacillus qinlingensis]|uniref:VCBS repeat-containing protein n=1 Tax=Paenibacillus qinlingensis TaxID=1837343 RepID=A0ABU1NPM7_9BACL|nr:hypothetical protein [Paenibacillus qinlingensis]MDR6549410.1 hypothetical protein [Paenibacillus qinlingensis]
MKKIWLWCVGAGSGMVILGLLTWTRADQPVLLVQSPQDVTLISEVNRPETSSGTVRRSLIEQLTAELSQVHEPIRDMTEWLQIRRSSYDSQKEPLDVIRTDLDQDGFMNEWVTVLAEDMLDEQTGVIRARKSYGVVIHLKDDQYTLQSLNFSSVNNGRAKVMTVEDLTSDGKPEIVWVSSNNGAHTTFSEYTVSSWGTGKLETYMGTAVIASLTHAVVQDRRLQLSGGLIDSVGAGPWQQEFTESYAIVQDKLKRIGRVYAQSPTPYHRLISGMWAESYGYHEQAIHDYSEAAEMKAMSYQDYAFIFEGEWVQGGINTVKEAEFDRTIKRFALLRKELLTEVARGVDPRNACLAAKKKTGFDMAWLTYLNAPAGYANPHWEEGTICSDIALLEP